MAAAEQQARAGAVAGQEEEQEAAGPGWGLALLPGDRFSAWLHCVCVVGFDLELGQAVEVTYPQNSKLTDKEKTNICYLSFPDSNAAVFDPGC